jgi:hypothetical protein
MWLESPDPETGERTFHAVGDAWELADCGKTPACYVYIDDGLFSGNSILGDLRGWLAGDAPNEALVHVIVMALHRGGQYYAKTSLEKAAKGHRKNIEFTWWRIVELEDRRTYINSSDVLRPTRIPTDATTQAYVKAMKHQPVLRSPRLPLNGDGRMACASFGLLCHAPPRRFGHSNANVDNRTERPRRTLHCAKK